MTPYDDRVFDQLGNIREQLGGIIQSQKDQQQDITEIRIQTTKTNGSVFDLKDRVGKLESKNKTNAVVASVNTNQRKAIGRILYAVAIVLGTALSSTIAFLVAHWMKLA